MPPPDYDTVIRRLNEHDVAFVLIGGMAAMAHGVSLVTFDSLFAVLSTLGICSNCNRHSRASIQSIE